VRLKLTGTGHKAEWWRGDAQHRPSGLARPPARPLLSLTPLVLGYGMFEKTETMKKPRDVLVIDAKAVHASGYEGPKGFVFTGSWRERAVIGATGSVLVDRLFAQCFAAAAAVGDTLPHAAGQIDPDRIGGALPMRLALDVMAKRREPVQ
jgi:hypothetical protein